MDKFAVDPMSLFVSHNVFLVKELVKHTHGRPRRTGLAYALTVKQEMDD